MAKKEFTHRELCTLAVGWLKRPQSRGGHGCQVAVSEVRTGWAGEIPDAIGYRFAGQWDDGTIAVEVKVSRADFLADAKKPHRNEAAGVGRWRYFMAPEGLIKPDELPPKWGLLEVNARGHIKTVVGVFSDTNLMSRIERAKAMAHDPVNTDGELFIIVRLFDRIGDPEIANERVKAGYRAITRCNEQDQQIRALQRDVSRLKWELQEKAQAA